MDASLITIIILSVIVFVLVVKDIASYIRVRKIYKLFETDGNDDDRYIIINGKKYDQQILAGAVALSKGCEEASCNECFLFGNDEKCRLKNADLVPELWNDGIIIPSFEDALEHVHTESVESDESK